MRISLKKKLMALYLASFAVLLVLGQNCSRFDLDQGAGSGAPSAVGAAGEAAPSVALLSSEQMLKAMISVTGTEGLGELTDPADDLVNTTYNLRNGSLPSSNTLDQATGPTMISVANIASTVCAKAVDRDRATGEAQRDERLFFRELDFSSGLSAQSSDSVSIPFARLVRNAWRRDPTQEELDDIVTFAQEFSVGANATDPMQTRNLALGICTAVLSGIDSLTY